MSVLSSINVYVDMHVDTHICMGCGLCACYLPAYEDQRMTSGVIPQALSTIE